MKQKKFLVLTVIALSILLISSKTLAAPSADILYYETDLGSGWWQYDYIFYNTSTTGEALYSVYLYPNWSTVDWLSIPTGWDSTLWGFTPIETDFIDTYSTHSYYDIAAGSSLSGFSFKINYRAGDIAYDAFFTGDNVISGTTALVPEPISSILFVAGGATLAFRRYMKRRSPSPKTH
jgi:hypothetical protein